MTTKELVASLYTDEDNIPIQLSPSQLEIFDCIFKKEKPRVQVICPSQFGKSLTVALGVLTRVSTFPEKWVIVAPQEDKARIIMGYIIQHAFDNEYTKNKLQLDKDDNLDRIRRERSKKRLTFKIGTGKIGEVMVLSSDERNKRDAGNTLMGYGAGNILLDEGALIGDDVHAKILRMLGGFSTRQTFFMKIGNPFRRNHFLRTWNDENYHRIFIDHERAIAEGRFTREFVDEMRKENLFDILYACKFPTDDEVDMEGWSRLLTDDEVDNSQSDSIVILDSPKFGVDVADGGGDLSVICRRNVVAADIVFASKNIHAMQVAAQVNTKAMAYGVVDKDITIDKTGVGVACYQKLREMGVGAYAFVAGESALDSKQFYNKRAESYWRMRSWIRDGGLLKSDRGWQELKNIKYRFDESGRIQIMSKDNMRSRGIKSPNYADALMLTFAKKETKRNTENENLEAIMMSMGGNPTKNKSRTGLSLRATSY